MFSVATFIIFFVAWIMLSGKFDLFHLALGGVSCLIVTLLSADLFFQERKKGLAARLQEAFRFIPYCGWLFWQIGVANFHVIALAISPRIMRREIDPYIFTFRTKLKTDFAKFVLANSITLTPGTVTIRIHDDLFYIHAISGQAAGDLASENMSEMERRVAWVFEGGHR